MPSEHARIREAYLKMVEEARYRPEAPSDGMGSTTLTEEELSDPTLLEQEATAYATRFIKEENDLRFRIGISNFETNRALVYIIEAARLLCSGHEGNRYAMKLLNLALEDVDSAIRRHRALE